MNGYIAFYKGKQLEVYAKTSLEARDNAAKQFKARKAYDVTVVLCERDGEQVTHSTGSIG
jgi:hypothetical protein